VARAIELGTDLPNLARNQFVMIDQSILAERAARWSSWNGHIPAARAEGRNLAMIVFSHGQGLELFDRSERPFDIFRILGVIAATGGIICAPFGWRPLFVQRLTRRSLFCVRAAIAVVTSLDPQILR
jgi:hypothetical protein